MLHALVLAAAALPLDVDRALSYMAMRKDPVKEPTRSAKTVVLQRPYPTIPCPYGLRALRLPDPVADSPYSPWRPPDRVTYHTKTNFCPLLCSRTNIPGQQISIDVYQ